MTWIIRLFLRMASIDDVSKEVRKRGWVMIPGARAESIPWFEKNFRTGWWPK